MFKRISASLCLSLVLFTSLCCTAGLCEPSYPSTCYVSVVWDSQYGKVTGGNKTVKAGDKVALKAIANKGAAFTMWTLNGEDVDWSASWTYIATGEDVIIEAHFVAAQADYLYISCQDRSFRLGEQIHENVFDTLELESYSWATLKISGLPPGLKYDEKGGYITGATSKVGVYYVTCSTSNANGYKQTATGVWTVGPAANGDYDDIGIDWDRLDVEWRTGQYAAFSLSDVVGDDDIRDITVSGLPAGIKAMKGSQYCCVIIAPGSFYGTFTKAGKYVLKITAKYLNGRTAKAQKTIIVADSGSRYVSIESPDSSRGTVTGSGVYAVGASARISAKPARGCYFAGWFVDPDYSEPFYPASGDFQKASDSLVVPDYSPAIYAKFISKDEDYVYFSDGDRWDVDTSYHYDTFEFSVYSETAAKVTAKGLPSGMKFKQNGSSCTIEYSDASKLKPGASDVTFTAKTATGVTTTHVLRVVIPNLQSSVFDGLDYSDSAYRMTLGVSDACVAGWVHAEYDTSYAITASGLPPGLKLTARYGSFTLTGTPTKAGTYTVTLTAKSRNTTEKATITITVDPIPEYAIGTFNGVLMNADGDVTGLVTLTAAQNGKLSAKVVSGPDDTNVKSHSYSANGWNCESDGRFDAYFTKGSSSDEYLYLTLKPDYDWDDALQMTGSCCVGGEEYEVMYMQRDPIKYGVWDAKDTAAVLSSFGTIPLACADYWSRELHYPEYGEAANVQLKVNKSTGAVSFSGKFFGTSVSGSAPLMFDADGPFVVFYLPVSEKWCAMTPNGIGKCITKRVYHYFSFRF